MRIKLLILTLFVGVSVNALADGQKSEKTGNDWFLQMGLDMSLQNPYGCDFSKVFPNGKSFGVDVAVGKWLTPAVGLRTTLNWENGIGLFRNDHANWLAPFNNPGENMDKGGYISVTGDMLVNLNRAFGASRGDLFWNSSVYPRFGLAYNLGSTKGSPLLGGGWLNTFKVNDSWSLYFDVAYNIICHGFVGKEAKEDGIGTNSNGYMSMGVGAIVNLGKKDGGISHADAGIWEDWFLQAALDMRLMNPYGHDFSKVFPKGNSYGINVAIGKEITPEFAVRAKLNWENGLIENKKLEWVTPVSHPEKNFDGGGSVLLSMDGMFDLKNIISAAHVDDKWHTQAFVRGGLISHREKKSASPVIGAGLEQSYQLNDKLSLFADLGYQVTTNEGCGFGAGFDSDFGSSGFFDVDLGVKVKF